MKIDVFNEITNLGCVDTPPQGDNSKYILYEQSQTGSGLVDIYEVSVKAVGYDYLSDISSAVLSAFDGNTGYSVRVIDQENHFERDAEDSTIWQKTYFELSEV